MRIPKHTALTAVAVLLLVGCGGKEESPVAKSDSVSESKTSAQITDKGQQTPDGTQDESEREREAKPQAAEKQALEEGAAATATQQQDSKSHVPPQDGEGDGTVKNKDALVADSELPPFPLRQKDLVALAAPRAVYMDSNIMKIDFAYTAPDGWKQRTLHLAYGAATTEVDRTVTDSRTGSVGRQTGTVETEFVFPVTIEPGQGRFKATIVCNFCPTTCYFKEENSGIGAEAISNPVTILKAEKPASGSEQP